MYLIVLRLYQMRVSTSKTTNLQGYTLFLVSALGHGLLVHVRTAGVYLRSRVCGRDGKMEKKKYQLKILQQ